MSAQALSDDAHRRIEELLAAPDAEHERRFPGASQARQPVHTVYVPGHTYTPELPGLWGRQALDAVTAGGGAHRLLELLDIDPAEHETIAALLAAKLAAEPIEDLRIDFEDGFGDQGDEAEDTAVAAAARAVGRAAGTGRLPPFVGIRFKCLEPATRSRGLRTLALFVAGLVEGGGLPDGLRLTLPKVTTCAQVEAMVLACEDLEDTHGLPAGRLGFEIQVETPQSVLGPDGTALIAPMLHAGQGRVTGLHYGTYDYSASVGIGAGDQSMAHPAADHAKAVMQVAAGETGVQLSDGSTNVLPIGEQAAVAAAWRLHGRLVARSLHRGYYQGWDLHAAQLPSRFAATYAYFRAGLPDALRRLVAYLGDEAGAVLDEPATAKAMAGFVLRAVHCGAVPADELAGLSRTRLETVARTGRDAADA